VRTRAAALVALFAAAGCATPQGFVRTIDNGHDAITRGICDVVDATDRAFGEPRVEDRERIVRLSVGPEVELREGTDRTLGVPLSLRAPLPALERRANIFLQVDTAAESLTDGDETEVGSADRNTTVSATVLTRVASLLDTGVRLDLFLDGGAQTGVRPFARWEHRFDGMRALLEQQVYLNSDVGFGARSIAQLDRVLGGTSFVRARASWEANGELEGVNQDHALIYRRPAPMWNAALSLELGAAYNRFDGDPETGETGPAADPDEAYLRARVTGRVGRPWIEYEVAPALHHPWRHDDAWEWGVTLSLRLLYEDFLRRPAGEGTGAGSPRAPAAAP